MSQAQHDAFVAGAGWRRQTGWSSDGRVKDSERAEAEASRRYPDAAPVQPAGLRERIEALEGWMPGDEEGEMKSGPTTEKRWIKREDVLAALSSHPAKPADATAGKGTLEESMAQAESAEDERREMEGEKA